MILFGGIVSVILGLMIWGAFPLSGVWAVGVLFGVMLAMSGRALVAIGTDIMASHIETGRKTETLRMSRRLQIEQGA